MLLYDVGSSAQQVGRYGGGVVPVSNAESRLWAELFWNGTPSISRPDFHLSTKVY